MKQGPLQSLDEDPHIRLYMNPHLQHDFVNNQTTYLTTIASASKALQTQVADLAGDLVSPGQNNQFPRKNSNSNNVPVTDILKVIISV